MTEVRGKILWERMDWRWWLTGAVKITLFAGLFFVTSHLVDQSAPRWVTSVAVFLTLILGFPLIPFPPREGEEETEVGLRGAILGVGIVALCLTCFAALVTAILAYFFIGAPMVGDALAPLFVAARAHSIQLLLFAILLALLAILDRLGKPR